MNNVKRKLVVIRNTWMRQRQRERNQGAREGIFLVLICFILFLIESLILSLHLIFILSLSLSVLHYFCSIRIGQWHLSILIEKLFSRLERYFSIWKKNAFSHWETQHKWCLLTDFLVVRNFAHHWISSQCYSNVFTSISESQNFSRSALCALCSCHRTSFFNAQNRHVSHQFVLYASLYVVVFFRFVYECVYTFQIILLPCNNRQ